MKTIDKMTDQEVYLDWVNNFLTLPFMAAHYDYIPVPDLLKRINNGRLLHESNLKAK